MEKRIYKAPCIEKIRLDSEISLQLESVNLPPEGPGETTNYRPEYINDNPFKVHVI